MHDVFVSYRHNDDRLDGWVSAFVAALNLELRAIIKFPVDVYFDRSHDTGLRENHSVSASLDGRLNTRILLPVLSQTYCDTGSYAWKSEFIQFLEQERRNGQALEVALPSGNYASRVLPICIHELEREDVAAVEDALRSPLRSIDFVYREGGANRPLSEHDQEPGQTRAGTRYRNQLNKTALAIKELLGGMRAGTGGTATSAPTLPARIGATQYSYSVPAAALDRGLVAAPAPGAAAEGAKPGVATVYLAYTSQELRQRREDMALMLGNAGFSVVPAFDAPSEEDAFRAAVGEALAASTISLHLLGHEFGRRFEEDESVSFPAYQHQMAFGLAEAGKLRQISWLIPDPTRPLKPDQAALLSRIRNTLSERTYFSNASEATQLVEELRSMARQDEAAVPAVTDMPSEIIFVYNLADYTDAEALTDVLASEYPLEIMVIEPDKGAEARRSSVQQLQGARMAVVFFKHAADWAVPFVKEMWKDLGGAASPTQLVLLGDDDPRTNLLRSFKAPKVTSRIVSQPALAAEVAKEYQRLQG